MADIKYNTIPYSDFQNGDVIDAEKIDLNNKTLIDKQNEVVTNTNFVKQEISRHKTSADHDDRYFPREVGYTVASKVNILDSELTSIVKNTPSNIEVAQALVGVNGKVYDTLKQRLNSEQEDVDKKIKNVQEGLPSVLSNSDFVELPPIVPRSSLYSFTPNISSPSYEGRKSLQITATNYEGSTDSDKDFSFLLGMRPSNNEKIVISFKYYTSSSNKRLNIRMAYGSSNLFSLTTVNGWGSISLEIDPASLSTKTNFLYFDLMSSYTLFISDFNVSLVPITSNFIESNLPSSILSTNNRVKNMASTIHNSNGAIERLISVGSSYLDKISSFVYGNSYTAFDTSVQQVGGKYQIDCSSFASLLIHGVPFEQSRYNSKASNIYQDNFFHDIDSFKFRYANEMGRYAFDNGYAFIPKADFSNVEPGDVLFFSWNNGSTGGDLSGVARSSAFMKIDHVGMYLNKKNNAIHNLLQLDNGFTTVFYEANANYMNQCVLVARFPFAQFENRVPPNNLAFNSNKSLTATGTPLLGTYRLTKSLEQGKYYSLFFDGEPSPSGSYFIFTSGGVQIFNDGSRDYTISGVKRGGFRFTGTNSDIITVSIGAPSTIPDASRSGVIRSISIFEGFYTSMPSNVTPITVVNNVDFPLNSTYVSDLNPAFAPYYKYQIEGNRIYLSINLPFNTVRTGSLVLGKIPNLSMTNTQRLPCLLGDTAGGLSQAYLQVQYDGTVTLIPFNNTFSWKVLNSNGTIFI